MPKFIDLTGQRFGRLTVIKRMESRRSPSGTTTRWLCMCDCGNEKIVDGHNIKHGKTRSCGCIARERVGNLNKKHGLSKTRLHEIWWAMKQRTTDKRSQAYSNYGGRGIGLCKEWFEFIPFYTWAVQNGYDETLTIDRIDVNGDYCPQNCRWVSRSVQSLNTRRNVFITYKGKRQTLVEWSRELNFKYGILRQRLFIYGWSIERSFTTPVRKLRPRASRS